MVFLHDFILCFLVKWLYLREKVSKPFKLLQRLCFFLSAGCVSFTIYTGGRSSFLGIELFTVVTFIGYDII